MAERDRYRIGIDVGGTFTDIIVLDSQTGATRAVKVASNRAAPDQAVLSGIEKAGVAHDQIGLIVHGTTVATNALLERRGARTGFISTSGFRDVLELGRTTRLVPNSLYDPYFRKAEPLVARRHRQAVPERILADGSIELPLDLVELERVARELAEQGVESVAVGFINSFRNPAHEQLARGILERLFAFVTTSTDVLNEIREFERFSAAAINAYVMPLMAQYTQRLTEAARAAYSNSAFYTVGSNGGLLSTRDVSRTPVRTILSGPAAGIAAAIHLGKAADVRNLITYDMGGTSTDVALVADHVFPLKRETLLEGMVLRVPQLDIHTVGAGGGSIAGLDAGGRLEVGPESAGAAPGPACYGQGGTRPTVTDANVALGRLGADQELGGTLRISRAAADRAIADVAEAAGLLVQDMAAAILKVAVAKMASAVHEISVARGYDPAEFALLSYGGAGPLHAALIADELGIPEVIVPPVPGAFSARGTLCSALSKDRSRTLLVGLDARALDAAWSAVDELAAALREDFASEGLATDTLSFECQLDMRYRGQAHELTVALARNADLATVIETFEAAFEREYGRRDSDRGLELVNVRTVARLPLSLPDWPELEPAGRDEPQSHRDVVTANGLSRCPVWQREHLPARPVDGPAIIEEMSATTYVPPGWRLAVGRACELRLRRVGEVEVS